jgi:DNA (cytosine-5)-methyltransferase 1
MTEGLHVADRPEIPPVYGIGVCGGALGLELALEVAIPGYRTVSVVERETAVAGRMAQRIEEGSLAELAWWDDVTTFDGKSWRGIVSVLSAGFPCQPFSVAGKRKGKDDERWIWPDIKRVIRELGEELEIVFLENVPGLLLSTHSDFDRWDLEASTGDAIGGFGTVLADLAELGFDAEWICIKASDVGASHGRKRVFILAYRRRKYQHVQQWPAWAEFTRSGRFMGHSISERLEIRRCIGRDDEPECAAAERTGAALGHSPGDDERHVGEHAEGCQVENRGSGVHVEDSARPELDGCEGEAGRIGRRGVFEAGEQPGDSTRGGFGECGESSERIGFINRAIEELGCFAYGPTDSRWEDVLVRYPWLRPSYSQAEAESDLRDVADGLASLVAHERTGALRALGNGVVSLQASVAFTILLRRVLKDG